MLEFAVISTRNLNILRENGHHGVPRIAVQVMIQEFDRATNSFVYGSDQTKPKT